MDTTLKVLGMPESTITGFVLGDPSETVPFFLVISGRNGQEKVRVTAVSADGLSLTIERATSPVDFLAMPMSKRVHEELGEYFPLLPPPEWVCSPKVCIRIEKYAGLLSSCSERSDRWQFYWAGDECNCGCGSYDPDCAEYGVEITGCSKSLGESCSMLGVCKFPEQGRSTLLCC